MAWWKKGAALIPALWPVAGHAFDWTPDTTRYLSDPSFLPDDGQVESLSQSEYANLNETWKYLSTTKTEHHFELRSTVSQSFFYGVTDRLRLSGSADYSASRSKDTYYGAQPTFESSHHGFSNPTFGVDYRAIDQRTAPVSVDGFVSYTPAVNQNTAQSGTAEVAVSYEMRSATIYGYASAGYHAPSTTIDAFDGTIRSVNGGWGYTAGVDSQLRLTGRWAVNTGVSINTGTNQTDTDSGNNTAYLDRFDPTVNSYITLLVQIVPNRAVAGLRYQHDFIGDDHRSGSFNGTWTDQAEDFYSVNLRLLF